MKSLISKVILILALLPIGAYADVASDMGDNSLTLTQILNNAVDSGLSVDEAVKQMVQADNTLTSAIVAAAIVKSPGQANAIVTAAVSGGGSAESAVRAAVVATGASTDAARTAIVDAAKAGMSAAEAASMSDSLTQVADSASESTTQFKNTGMGEGGTVATGAHGLQTISGVSSSGGGAAATADYIQTVLDTRSALSDQIASIRTTLGISSGSDIDAALTALQTSLTNSQTNLSGTLASLSALSSAISSGSVTDLNTVLSSLQTTIASYSGGASTN